jgi:gliding motility-associated-like protein
LSVEDIENDNVYISEAISGTGNGTIEFESNSLCFDYTPDLTFLGEDIIEITVCDDGIPSMCKTVDIKIEINPNLLIYEGISPNGDGLNDTWIIEGIEYYPNNVIKVFNRSGMKIYEEYGYDSRSKVWNGEMNKGIHIGDVAPNGTYYYFIYLTEDTKKPIRGYVVIN